VAAWYKLWKIGVGVVVGLGSVGIELLSGADDGLRKSAMNCFVSKVVVTLRSREGWFFVLLEDTDINGSRLVAAGPWCRAEMEDFVGGVLSSIGCCSRCGSCGGGRRGGVYRINFSSFCEVAGILNTS
jgi:hypothetical protein